MIFMVKDIQNMIFNLKRIESIKWKIRKQKTLFLFVPKILNQKQNIKVEK